MPKEKTEKEKSDAFFDLVVELGFTEELNSLLGISLQMRKPESGSDPSSEVKRLKNLWQSEHDALVEKVKLKLDMKD